MNRNTEEGFSEGNLGSSHISPLLRKFLEGRKALCLIDGEHYPPVTEAALAGLQSAGVEIAGLVFLGGAEKVEDPAGSFEGYRIYGLDRDNEIPLDALDAALDEVSPDAVVDLSDEPVLGYLKRFRIASRALKKRCVYVGADFLFQPPEQAEVLQKPSIGVIGTGKRIGKTAVSIYTARLLKGNGFDPVIVCMGRGGPPEPDVVDGGKDDVSPEALIRVTERGHHAASDYWEDAILAGVVTVGCRRCGGGMGGNPFFSNVIEGARIANGLRQDFVIMEGSGPTLPPVRTDGNIVVLGAGQPLLDSVNMFGEYRILLSDLAIVTMCEEPTASEGKLEELTGRLREINPGLGVALTVFRPQPMVDISGRKVFYATTSGRPSVGSIVKHLEEECGCQVCGTSTSLGNRAQLRQDLDSGLEGCEVLLTEIKAASIDVAARKAAERGLETVFLNNNLKLVGGTVDDLDEAIISLCTGLRRSS
jgi:cyclic 2,3-diphosphoglycerate synthetase